MIVSMQTGGEPVPARRATRRPIVVALGASGGAPNLRLAKVLAKRDGAAVVVASVVEPPPIYAFEPRRALLTPWTIDQQLADRRRSIGERLERVGWHRDGTDGPTVEVMYGDVAGELANLARERDARLLVMGIGPHGIAHRLIATGTAHATSRRAPCPVLAVGERARELPRVAVVAIDFSPESINAAREALPLLAEGAEVHLVHAWTRLESAIAVHELQAMNDAYAASIPERFALVRSALGDWPSVNFTTQAIERPAPEAVLGAARARHADIVVAGTHGYGLLERWVLGSTSTALLRAAECSVLLAPEPPVAERTRLIRHMTGTSVVREPEEWDAELRAFVSRNHDRRTTLEIDDRNIGAQVQESGYALIGAAYDPHDRNVALMFGGGDGRAHLTRSLGRVHSVAVASGPSDEDRALCIESDYGSALITFLDRRSDLSSSANA